MKTIKREELKGGYTMGKKIIVDACEIYPWQFEVMALYEDGEELASKTVKTETDALRLFDEIVLEYAEPLQKSIYGKLEAGKKYTFVYLNDFGFPVAQKIKFESMKCTTYAQYSDVVKMIFTPYRKRNLHGKYFYNCSLMIFEGWQDLKREDTRVTIKEDDWGKLEQSKYGCFDSRYIEDLEKIFKNPVVIYKNYKTSVNGKIYA